MHRLSEHVAQSTRLLSDVLDKLSANSNTPGCSRLRRVVQKLYHALLHSPVTSAACLICEESCTNPLEFLRSHLQRTADGLSESADYLA